MGAVAGADAEVDFEGVPLALMRFATALSVRAGGGVGERRRFDIVAVEVCVDGRCRVLTECLRCEWEVGRWGGWNKGSRVLQLDFIW